GLVCFQLCHMVGITESENSRSKDVRLNDECIRPTAGPEGRMGPHQRPHRRPVFGVAAKAQKTGTAPEFRNSGARPPNELMLVWGCWFRSRCVSFGGFPCRGAFLDAARNVFPVHIAVVRCDGGSDAQVSRTLSGFLKHQGDLRSVGFTEGYRIRPD